MLQIVMPDTRFLTSYIEALREGYRYGLGALDDAAIDAIAQDPFPHFLTLNQQNRTITYHNGAVYPCVPVNYCWAVEGDRFIGGAYFHFAMNAFLEEQTGHLGYAVRPSERRKGYATRILALQLPIMKAKGFASIYVMAGEGNVGSWKAIEANGGTLINKVPSVFIPGSMQRRYQIALSAC